MGHSIKYIAPAAAAILLLSLSCPARDSSAPDGKDYVTYVVKWYETLDDVAAKFGVSKELIKSYNNLSSDKLNRRQELRIPESSAAAEAAGDNDAGKTAQAIKDKLTEVKDTIGGRINSKVDRIYDNIDAAIKEPKVTLMLPFDATSEDVNTQEYEFYSGFLLALRELSEQGRNCRLNVVDCTGGPGAADYYIGEDLIIGPVSSADLEKMLGRCTGSTTVVSPLDSRAAALSGKYARFCQAPTPMSCQYGDICDWVTSERKGTDKVIVLYEKGKAPTALRDSLVFRGIPVSEMDYGILEGREVIDKIETMMTTEGTNRVVIASDEEAFVNDAVRNCALMTFRNYDLVLYSTSRIRNYETIEPENLHKLSSRVTTAHYIDYESAGIKKFLMSYRALFGEEPTQFSFQGYDIAMFFITMQSEGRSYEEPWKGLQADFKLRRNGEGLCNTAVRRIIYADNYSTVLQ